MIHTEKIGNLTVHKLHCATDKEIVELFTEMFILGTRVLINTQPSLESIKYYVSDPSCYRDGVWCVEKPRISKIVVEEVDYRIEGI